jgi:hypothetical protein
MVHAGGLLSCLALFVVVGCSRSSGSAGAGDDGDDDACYPDNDGMTGDVDGMPVFNLTVDDTGFSKTLLTTQNSAMVMLTLTNNGTTPHGFQVGCTSVSPSYPNLPAGCGATACFPANSAIPPLDPGKSATILFVTPVPDNLLYPFTSNEPADSAVPGLNDGQWNLI